MADDIKFKRGDIVSDHYFLGGDDRDPSKWVPVDEIKKTLTESKKDESNATEEVYDYVKPAVNWIGNKISDTADWANKSAQLFGHGFSFKTTPKIGAYVQDKLTDLGLSDVDAQVEKQLNAPIEEQYQKVTGEKLDEDKARANPNLVKMEESKASGDLLTSQDYRDKLKAKYIEDENKRLAEMKENTRLGGVTQLGGEMLATHLIGGGLAKGVSAIPGVGTTMAETLGSTESMLDKFRKAEKAADYAKLAGTSVARATAQGAMGSLAGGTIEGIQNADLATGTLAEKQEFQNRVMHGAKTGFVLGSAGDIIGQGIGAAGQKMGESAISKLKQYADPNLQNSPWLRGLSNRFLYGLEHVNPSSSGKEMGFIKPAPGEVVESGKNILRSEEEALKIFNDIKRAETSIGEDINQTLVSAKNNNIGIDLKNSSQNSIVNGIQNTATPSSSGFSALTGFQPSQPTQIPVGIRRDPKILQELDNSTTIYDDIVDVLNAKNDPIEFKAAYDRFKTNLSDYANGNAKEKQIFKKLLSIKDSLKQDMVDSVPELSKHMERFSNFRRSVNENLLNINGKDVHYAELPNREQKTIKALMDVFEKSSALSGTTSKTAKTYLTKFNEGMEKFGKEELDKYATGQISRVAIPGYTKGHIDADKLEGHLKTYADNITRASDDVAAMSAQTGVGSDSLAGGKSYATAAATGGSSPSTIGKQYSTAEFLGRRAKNLTDFKSYISNKNFQDEEIRELGERMVKSGFPDIGNELIKSGSNVPTSFSRDALIYAIIQQKKYDPVLKGMMADKYGLTDEDKQKILQTETQK